VFPLLLGFAIVGGLVSFAIKKATGPSIRIKDEKEKLARLKTKAVLTLDEAEDGAVLARRYGDSPSQKRFAREVEKLKKNRLPI
jgi:hypothetical protein